MADPYTFSYYTSDGASSTTINDGTIIVVRGMRGFGLPHLRVAGLEYPYHHGKLNFGRPYLPDREMIVVLGIHSATAAALISTEETLREALSPFPYGETLGRLNISRPDSTNRSILCWLVEYSGESDDHFSPYWCQRTVRFWAPDPRFYDPTEQYAVTSQFDSRGLTFGATDSASEALFRFDAVDASPRDDLVFAVQTEYPEDEEVTFGTSGDYITSTRTVTVSGDLPTRPRFIIFNAFDALKLENVTTGKTMTIEDAVTGGPVEIDMEAGTVEDNGTNIIDYLSDDSEFWDLVPGANVLTYYTDSSGTVEVQVYWYNRYSSI